MSGFQVLAFGPSDIPKLESTCQSCDWWQLIVTHCNHNQILNEIIIYVINYKIQNHLKILIFFADVDTPVDNQGVPKDTHVQFISEHETWNWTLNREGGMPACSLELVSEIFFFTLNPFSYTWEYTLLNVWHPLRKTKTSVQRGPCRAASSVSWDVIPRWGRMRFSVMNAQNWVV